MDVTTPPIGSANNQPVAQQVQPLVSTPGDAVVHDQPVVQQPVQPQQATPPVQATSLPPVEPEQVSREAGSGSARQPTPQPIAVPASTVPPGPSVPIAGHKEAEPVRVTADVSEIVIPSEQAPELHPEVEAAGVEVSPNHEVPQLTLADKKAGLDYAKEATPVVVQPTGMVQLPMTEEQAKQTINVHKKFSDAMLWFAMTILKQYKRMHQQITQQQPN